MQYFSSKKKQKLHILDTRPSHNESYSSLKNQMIRSQSFQTFRENIQSHQIDSTIKFTNEWKFEGQHLQGKFHGWGRLISDDGNVVYKGNFENGFFHNYGKIIFHEMFSYLFCTDQIKAWIEKRNQLGKIQENSLTQIQVKNPFSIKPKKRYSQFCKSKFINQSASQSISKSRDLSFQKKGDLTVSWLKYEGQFKDGNATGFGTLKIKIEQPNKQFGQTVKIIGKFLEGKIVSGIIKK